MNDRMQLPHYQSSLISKVFKISVRVQNAKNYSLPVVVKSKLSVSHLSSRKPLQQEHRILLVFGIGTQVPLLKHGAY